MKTLKTPLPLAALAVLMSLGPASEAQAQVFASGTPPAAVTVAWDATSVALASPPAVPGLNNTIFLSITGGGPETVTNRDTCSQTTDIAGRTNTGFLTHQVTLNGGTVHMPVKICGDWAVGKLFRIGWSGHAKVPASGTFGTVFLTSFGVASNCIQTHGATIISGPDQGSYAGSTNCWTNVTITD